ncbi:hypothetical protein PSP20601_04949 [Pandoraea sputorum]|nr:hypothetical protein PSP20601_04949 [Pandoraea sputorum]
MHAALDVTGDIPARLWRAAQAAMRATVQRQHRERRQTCPGQTTICPPHVGTNRPGDARRPGVAASLKQSRMRDLAPRCCASPGAMARDGANFSSSAPRQHRRRRVCRRVCAPCGPAGKRSAGARDTVLSNRLMPRPSPPTGHFSTDVDTTRAIGRHFADETSARTAPDGARGRMFPGALQRKNVGESRGCRGRLLDWSLCP